MPANNNFVLVDSNVLIDVFGNDKEWADWSEAQLRAQSQVLALCVNPIIYAELSLMFLSAGALDQALASLEISLRELPRDALFLAGLAFRKYRTQGGTKSNVLADCFIGAHAAVAECPLLTRDIRRYQHYFPTVQLIYPL